MISFKQFMAEDTLGDVSLMMALRHAFTITQSDAEQLLPWLRREDDMDDDLYNHVVAHFDDELVKNNVPHEGLDEYLRRYISRMLLKTYKLELE